ncbi:hypothetical protein BGX21_005295, partial [Mortierella sp. AD011]
FPVSSMTVRNTANFTNNQLAITWLEFFTTKGFKPHQKASASAAWLATIQGDESKLKDWKATKNAREKFWKDLKKNEEIEIQQYEYELTLAHCQN